MVGAALALRHDVVHGEVPKGKHRATAGAVSFLLPEELVLVRPVVRECPEVRPARNVGAVVNVVEEPERFLEPRLDQRCG